MPTDNLSLTTINDNKRNAELRLSSFDKALTKMSDDPMEAEAEVMAAYGLVDTFGSVKPHKVTLFDRTFPILRRLVILNTGDVVTEFNVHDASQNDSENDIVDKQIICQFYLIGRNDKDAWLAVKPDASATDCISLVSDKVAPVLLENLAYQALRSGVFSVASR